MVNLSFDLRLITTHVNQTYLVDNLLRKGVLEYEEILNYQENEHGDYPDIYQWLLFPKLWV